MYEIDIIKVIQMLDETSTGKTSEYFAEIFSVSVPTFKSYIKNYNNILLKSAGVKIVGKSGRGNGYYLDIKDKNLYEKYMSNHLSMPNYNFNKQNDRIKYIIQQLMTNEGYIKADNLADSLYISKSQISRDLKLVKDVLSSYNIKIIDKPFYGLKIEATEFEIRSFLANQYDESIFLEQLSCKEEINIDKTLEELKNIIVEKSAHHNYLLNDMTCKNLTIHLFVSLNRINDNSEIKIEDEMKKSLKNEKEFSLAIDIVKELENKFDICFSNDEVYYIAMHLSGKKTVDKNIVIDSNVQYLVNDIFEEILNVYGINFKDNLNLKIMMSLHIIPLLSRIKYHIVLKNPMLKQIKKNLWYTYEFALCAANVINTHCNCCLSEDEIAYFALHLKVALDQDENLYKKRILLVCSTGRGCAEMLKCAFLRKFNKYIKIADTCDILEINKINLDQYDCIFSVVPIPIKVSIPIFKIDYFINESTEEDIKNVLKRDILSYKATEFFKNTYFYNDLSGTCKEEIILQIVKRIRKSNYLPKEFEQLVFEREIVSSTDFGNLIAIPHPCKHLNSNSFLSISILDRPIIWCKNKVKIVILFYFEKGFTKEYADVVKMMTELMTNKTIIRKLLEKPTYENFINLIQNIY